MYVFLPTTLHPGPVPQVVLPYCSSGWEASPRVGTPRSPHTQGTGEVFKPQSASPERNQLKPVERLKPMRYSLQLNQASLLHPLCL